MHGSDNKRLLLITPENPSSAKLAQQLASCCFDVVTADGSDAALNTIQSHAPDLILLDPCIHKLHDTDLLILLKEDGSISKDIPVIVVSDSNNIETKLHAYSMGAADYIVKPFDYRELIARIQVHINVYETMKSIQAENARLEQLAITDASTGLYNKRYIIDRLHSEISHSVRYKEPISFIMIDVDYFKSINDTYGHLAGDGLLKELANLIKGCIRTADIAARYGGEEFLIICPNTDTSGAKILSERIREEVHNTHFKVKGRTVKISLSIGIRNKELDPETDMESAVTQLIDEADSALYKAKFRGRNRVEIFTDKPVC